MHGYGLNTNPLTLEANTKLLHSLRILYFSAPFRKIAKSGY